MAAVGLLDDDHDDDDEPATPQADVSFPGGAPVEDGARRQAVIAIVHSPASVASPTPAPVANPALIRALARPAARRPSAAAPPVFDHSPLASPLATPAPAQAPAKAPEPTAAPEQPPQPAQPLHCRNRRSQTLGMLGDGQSHQCLEIIQ